MAKRSHIAELCSAAWRSFELRETGFSGRIREDTICPVTKASRKISPPAQRRQTGKAERIADPRLYSTPEAKQVKEEICAVGRKLWLRQFVDGNGGNISYLIGPNEVLCTPTLVSKYDLTPADLCLVDLDGNQLAGKRPLTSEILLHLEIYKAAPGARAAVHCHPPHTTAYAITGLEPDNLLLPEYEILIGQVAVAPYETPGTPAFARTVLPYVKNHNAILLSNHGLICWADTVTKAEWHCEVLESYCTTLTVARQLGRPLAHIPDAKAAELRARRLSLGLPDVGLNGKRNGKQQKPEPVAFSERKLEALVERVVRRVLAEDKGNGQ